MKTFAIIPLLIALLVLVASKLALAHDDKYVSAMQKNIEAVYTATTIPDLQTAVNVFERIAEAEKTKWEPFYYASFGYVMMANREQDGAKKDTYLDLALARIEKAAALQPNDAEIVALEGFVHMIRVTVDPASRGQQYSGMAFQSFSKAVALNPENPRALSLLAQMQYGTAQFFKAPTTEACATLQRALEQFETYTTDSVLAPQWGKGMAERLKEKCQ
jgi:tetratricopeptide (TPR) repeat protein